MKITIITSPFGYIPPDGIGAVEKIWYDLSIEFLKKGHQVTIVSKLPEKRISETNFWDNNGVFRTYVKGYKRTSSIYTDLIFDFLYSVKSLRRISKTDVLVLNTFWSPFLSYLFKRKYNVSIYNIARLPKGQYGYLSHIDKLVACGSMIQKEVMKQNPELSNVCTINNPVNLSLFFNTVFLPIEKYVHVVYTGRIHFEKGLLNLVKALSLFSNKIPVKLSLVGTADMEKGGGGQVYCDDLRSHAKGIDLVFAGEFSNPELMADYMRTAHIYCYPPLPTTGDAMPCAPLEAMALGLPVIVSDLPCFDDYIVDKENAIRFTVSHNPVRHLERAIELLVFDEVLRRQIGVNASKTASRFSSSGIAGQYIDLFQSLLENGESLA